MPEAQIMATLLTPLNVLVAFLSKHFDVPPAAIVLNLMVIASFLNFMRAFLFYRDDDSKPKKAFPFLRLPPELRVSVYEYLIEDGPCYPSIRSEAVNNSLPTAVASSIYDFTKHSLQRVLPLPVWRWIYTRSRGSTPYDASRMLSFWRVADALAVQLFVNLRRLFHRTKGTGILFVNRQIHNEFLSAVCKQNKLTLLINDNNHGNKPLWNISQTIAKEIRKCEVNVLATPGMLPNFDRTVAPTDWLLGHQACSELKQLTGLETLNLRVHALGSQIWNPLWLWWYTSQLFESGDIKSFKEITFHLPNTDWSPGENKLCQTDDGQWEWRCAKGHSVVEDPSGVTAIREFCAALYSECGKCPPRP